MPKLRLSRFSVRAPVFRAALSILLGVLLVYSYQSITAEEKDLPSRAPDRVILTWSGDPATTASVTWRTSTSVKRALAQIALSDDGPGFVKEAKDVRAATSLYSTDNGEAHAHSVTFTGLQPGTQYLYRVGDGDRWSAWAQFRTASDKSEPFSFIYVGDSQNDVYSMWSRVIREAYSRASDARFIIHAGDLINRHNRDIEWGEWHRAAGWLNKMVPSIPSPGNHEYGRDPDGERRLSVNWRHQFTLPENGPPGLQETCYFIDIQGVRIISLNSNVMHDEQAAWLSRLLQNNPNTWTILTFHHPIFSSGRGRDNKALRAAWKPVFDKHRMDLVLQGHDHTYARGNVPTGVGLRDGEAGTLYVNSVSGPKMYSVERADWMERVAEDTQLYQIISVNGDTLQYEARTARGILYDAFELHKRPGRPNAMRDLTPPVPERRRAATVTSAAD